MYNQLLLRLKDNYSADRVLDGIFGAMMNVSLVNDVSLPLPLDLVHLLNLLWTADADLPDIHCHMCQLHAV